MKRITIETEDGRLVTLRAEDIISIWKEPENEIIIVNFLQGDRSMMLKTKESLESLNVRIRDEQ